MGFIFHAVKGIAAREADEGSRFAEGVPVDLVFLQCCVAIMADELNHSTTV